MSSLTLAPARLTRHVSVGRAAAGGAVVLGGLGLGESVTHEGAANTGELSLDVTISHAHSALLTAGARALDVVASPVFGPLLVLVAAAALWRRRHAAAAVALTAMTMFGWLVASAAKVVLHRQRPPMETVHALVRETAADSCPSGHTAFAASLVVGVALALHVSGRSPRHAWLLGVPFVLMVAASRLYLGAHYLGDVVTSMVLVAGLGLMAWVPVAHLARRVAARQAR